MGSGQGCKVVCIGVVVVEVTVVLGVVDGVVLVVVGASVDTQRPQRCGQYAAVVADLQCFGSQSIPSRTSHRA